MIASLIKPALLLPWGIRSLFLGLGFQALAIFFFYPFWLYWCFFFLSGIWKTKKPFFILLSVFVPLTKVLDFRVSLLLR